MLEWMGFNEKRKTNEQRNWSHILPNELNIISFSDAQASSRRRRKQKPSLTGSNGAYKAILDSEARPKSHDANQLGRIFEVDFGSSDAAPDREFLEFVEPDEDAQEASSDRAGIASVLKGAKAKLKERAAARSKAKAKKSAERKFAKAYEGKAAPTDADAGPRAALYKGQMGSSQKKAAVLQSRASDRSMSSSSSSRSRKSADSKAMRRFRPAAIALIAAAFVVSLYSPAQQCYTQMRECERLNAEYAAVTERNEALQGSIDSLQTSSGIEDKAHADFGYVRKNEKIASVGGMDVEDSSDFTANVPPGSVPAPDTWYSQFLDIVFNYQNPS